MYMETILRMQPLPDFPGYSVGDDGSVWGPGRWGVGSWLQPGTTGDGYQYVSLCTEGFKRSAKVHRLVAYAFLGQPPQGKTQVRHLDGNPANNAWWNLRWGGQSEQEADKAAHGTKSFGETHASAKLSAADIPVIREQHAAGVRNVAQASRYGVSETAIRKILSGETWGHVADDGDVAEAA